jgi:hypothetical protein
MMKIDHGDPHNHSRADSANDSPTVEATTQMILENEQPANDSLTEEATTPMVLDNEQPVDDPDSFNPNT